MTRDEAGQIVNKAVDKAHDERNYKCSDWFIPALEALGVLKLEQPRSAKDKFTSVIIAWTTADANKIWQDLQAAGLDIVERKK